MKIEALLLIVAALQDRRIDVEGQIYPLDMAENSVDDEYNGCTEKMADRVEREYLKKELQNSNDFKKVWEAGKNYIKRNQKKKSSLKIEHKLAMYAYTYKGNNKTPKIFDKFNEDTRNGRKKYTANTYNWYSLYFLLTDAIHILKKPQKDCYETFRGTNVAFTGEVLKSVRFGSFTSSSTYRDVAKKFGKLSCFEIRTCEGAKIAMYSVDHDEGEVLIPPYEVFNIIEIKTNADWCKTVYVLKSTGVRSDLNCALIKTPQESIML